MAASYSVVLQTQSTLAHLCDWLSKQLDFNRLADEQGYAMEGDGLICHIKLQSDLGKELVLKHFGIDSNVKLTCRLDKFEGLEAGLRNVVRICMVLLKYENYDLLLLEGGELGLILRTDGQIRMDCRDSYWCNTLKRALAENGLSFQVEDLARI